MEQRRPRGNAVQEQLVDELLIEAKSGRIDCPVPVGNHSRPGDGEAIGGHAELRHQCDVLAPAVIVVAGDVPGLGHSPLVREPIPDRLALSVFESPALDLIRR